MTVYNYTCIFHDGHEKDAEHLARKSLKWKPKVGKWLLFWIQTGVVKFIGIVGFVSLAKK
jgi:hypothetical protein